MTNTTNQKEGTVIPHNVHEIVAYYDNSQGNIGFSFSRSNPKNQIQRKTFHNIFTGTKTLQMDGKVVFYYSIQSIAGRAYKAQYLGGIPTLPSLTRNSINGAFQLSLQRKTRWAMLRRRSSHLLQKVSRAVLHWNPQEFSYHLWLPALGQHMRNTETFNVKTGKRRQRLCSLIRASK